MASRSRRLRDSLGSSWGDAEYSSDGVTSDYSISDAASEVDLEDSDKEIAPQPRHPVHHQPRKKKEHPLPSMRTRPKPSGSPKTQRTVTLPQAVSSPQNTPQSSRRMADAPGEEGYKQSFIMPSMDDSPSKYPNGSPVSQARHKKVRTPSLQQPVSASPRLKSRKPTRNPVSHKSLGGEDDEGPWYYIELLSRHIVLPLVAYLLNVFSYGMRHVVKPFLGLALGIGVLALGVQFATGFVRSTLSNALLAPVCLIPGSSYVVPSCATASTEHQQANFEELINVQTRFEDILDASKDTSQLPATIKNSEIAIRDLRTLVRHSQLPSRKSLDHEFEYFVQTAGEASQDLSRYNSRIGAAMDRVIATNTWTMAVLQGLEQSEASVGTVSRMLSAVTGTFISSAPSLQERIFDQYILHVGKNKEEITSLITTAQALLKILQNLDDRLGTIYAIALTDDQTITKSQEELLSSLWTKLGRNRHNVQENTRQLRLLQNISAYRKRAVMHVSETLLKLQDIQAELENLREGVAAPEILGHRGDLPLTFHLELIERGVERLRVARGESMRVEGESYRNLVRGGKEGGAARELPAQRNMPTISVR